MVSKEVFTEQVTRGEWKTIACRTNAIYCSAQNDTSLAKCLVLFVGNDADHAFSFSLPDDSGEKW